MRCARWARPYLRSSAPAPHRQYVFTLPRRLRHFFARRRKGLGELCRIAERLLSRAYAEALPAGRPALMRFLGA